MSLNEIDWDLPEAGALNYSQLQENKHFEINELNGLFHWESIGPCEDLTPGRDTCNSPHFGLR